ncbi:MAG TPA: two-component regulator propeller domain-containing protein, partial [Pyrinomonadaceae bacterium]|nr:two-component regulator propeller domain-containing protein [Pyrinomonadaceae bacterium]
HDSWTFKEGAPTNVEALAQTSDGFLWLGTAGGLFRFDGVRFEAFNSPLGDRLLSNGVRSLLAPVSGGLWVGYLFGGFSFINNGRVKNYSSDPASPTGSVNSLAQDRDGIVWAATTSGLWRFEHSTWQRIVTGLFETVGVDRDGVVWALTEGRLFCHRPGRNQIQLADENETLTSATRFTLDADGVVVTSLVMDQRVTKSSRNTEDQLPAYPVLRKDCGQIIDRANSFWIKCNDRPLLHVAPSEQGYNFLNKANASNSERYDLILNSQSRLVDREGNIWFGNNTGLYRFFYSPTVKQEFPEVPASLFALAADDNGSVWSSAGNSDLYHLSNGKTEILKKRARWVVAYRAPDATFWFGGDGGLFHLVQGNLVQTEFPPEMAKLGYFLQAITQDRNGGLWVSFGRHGLYRLAGGVWTSFGGREDLPRTGVVCEFTDTVGRVWFGYTNNQLAVLEGDRVRVFGPNDGVRVGNISAIHGRASAIWIGGEFGLQQIDGEAFHTITAINPEWLRGISGIVETADGDLWLNGIFGIFHIRRTEISAALKDPAYRVVGEHFGRREGMPGFAGYLRPLPTIIEGSDGRLWVATTNGLVWLDPANAQKHVLQPSLTIQSVSADDKFYESGVPLTFPARTGSVEINFAAVSLSNPEAVRFRYRLQEKDKDWHEVTTANPVAYRNLSPGQYHFIVNASDSNGVWSEKVANVDFTILPTFYQTRWFLLLCIAAGLFVIWALYQLRVRQVARAISVRFDERLAERTRIARELHDTFLQTVQGSKLVADDALENPDDSAHLRRAMEQLSGWLGQATAEGRAALNSLRTSTIETNDLAAALRRATQECWFNKAIAVKFLATGGPRDMHPVARDEIFRIGYEAIRNACEHASASQLEIALTYARDLTLRVNDNGIGMEAAVLTEGKQGHFGLQGMRERAERIGSKLTLVSSASSGTQLTLVVPGNVVFRKSNSHL